MNVNFYRQSMSNDCGPTCLRIALGIFGKNVPIWEIIDCFPVTKDGWSIEFFMQAANHFGVKVKIVDVLLSCLCQLELPVVILMQKHYVLVYKVTKSHIYIADPRIGKCVYSIDDFIEMVGDSYTVLQLAPIAVFGNNKRTSAIGLSKDFMRYYYPYRKYLFQIFGIVLLISVAQLILPFVSRAVIDTGIETSSWDFVKLLIVASILLAVIIIGGNFVQTYLFTHIANRVKSVMLDDYMSKVLGIKYTHFMGLNIGDLLQRVTDNERIQNYVVTTLLHTITSILLLLVGIIALSIFKAILAIIFAILASIYIGWNILFLNQRKILDFNF